MNLFGTQSSVTPQAPKQTGINFFKLDPPLEVEEEVLQPAKTPVPSPSDADLYEGVERAFAIPTPREPLPQDFINQLIARERRSRPMLVAEQRPTPTITSVARPQLPERDITGVYEQTAADPYLQEVVQRGGPPDHLAPLASDEEATQYKPMVATPQDVKRWTDMGPIDVGDTWEKIDLGEKVPFYGSGKELRRVVDVWSAVNRLKKSSYDSFDQQDADKDLVNELLLDMDERAVRGVTTGGKILEGGSELPKFMYEFLATGGLATLGQKSALKVTAKLGQKAAGRAAMKMAVAGGRAVFRTLGQPQTVAKSAFKNMLPKRASFTDKGQLLIQEAGDKPFTAVIRAIGDTAIENLSEEAGGSLMKALGKVTPGFVKKPFAKIRGALPKNAKVNDIFKAAGFHGIPEEYLEERYGNYLRALTGIEDFGTGEKGYSPRVIGARLKGATPLVGNSLSDVLAEIGIISIPGMARLGLNVAAGQPVRADLQADAKKPADVLVTFASTPKALKGKKRKVAVSGTETPVDIMDFGDGTGLMGKAAVFIDAKGKVINIPGPTTKIESLRLLAALRAQGIDFRASQNEIVEQLTSLKGDKEGLTSCMIRLSQAPEGMGDAFLSPQDVVKLGTGRTIQPSVDKMTTLFSGRIKKFAKVVPAFKINPTFHVQTDKEGGLRLVFKDHSRFRFHPEYFGLDSSKLHAGQTVRIDMESLTGKPKAKTKVSTATLGSPAVRKDKLELSQSTPTGKTPTKQSIVAHLKRSFGVPIRGFGTHRKKALGFYNTKARGVRLRDVRDIETACHEVAHHLDWYVHNRISKKVPTPLRKELIALGKELYGDKKPPGRYASEGFAEFVSYYLNSDMAQEKAPKFYGYFVNTYLKNHTEEAAKLAEAKKMITAWRRATAFDRVGAMINYKPIKGTLKERVDNLLMRLDRAWRDPQAGIRREFKKAGIKPGDVDPGVDPIELITAYSSKAPSKTRTMLMDHTFNQAGDPTGASLLEVLKPVAAKIKEFTQYAVAARNISLRKRGIKAGLDPIDAQAVYDEYNSPEWREVLQGVTDWNHRVLDYVVEMGALESETAELMKKLNPVYIPFQRAFEQGEVAGRSGTGRGIVEAGRPAKAIKGSGREYVDPFESMIVQTERMISIAQKADVARSFAKLAESKKGLAGLIWRVPAPQQAVKFQAEKIKKDILALAEEKLGMDFSEGIPDGVLENWDEIVTVFLDAPNYYGKDNIVPIVVDGKKSWYEVHPELYRVLKGMDAYVLPKFLNMTLGKSARAVRLGATGLNPAFSLVRNVIRDAWMFAVTAKHAKWGPASAWAGTIKELMGTTSAQKFAAMGGTMSGMTMNDRTATQHLRGELLASTTGRFVIHHATHPITAMREIFGIPESGPRVAEFEAALKEGERKYGKGSKSAAIYALNAAQDVTVNFTRAGEIARVLNQFIPFFNAGIQGADKICRAAIDNPTRFTLMAMSNLTLPALMAWYRNKDEEWYRNLSSYERVNYLHFRVPGTEKIIRLPVPFELGHIFMSIPVATLDAAYQDNPNILKNDFKMALETNNIVDWPALIGPAIDVASNKDWANRPIVSQSNMNKLPEDRYGPYTSKLFKVIGNTLKVSPSQLEYLANGYSGGLYRRVSTTIFPKTETATVETTPVVGTLFMKDPGAPRRQVQEFYREKENLDQRYASKKITPKDAMRRKQYHKIAQALGIMRKQMQRDPSPETRQKMHKRMKVAIGSLSSNKDH